MSYLSPRSCLMEYSFDQVADLLDEMAEQFPPVFFE